MPPSDTYYKSTLLEDAGVFHGFGTKAAPPFPDDVANPAESQIPRTFQNHGADIHFLDAVDTRRTYTGDAYFTARFGIVCYVRTADCLPLLIYDRGKKIVGAIHAGWRGAAAHIVKRALSELVKRGGRAPDIIAAIGPHIRQNCYRVGGDVEDAFRKNDWASGDLFERVDGNLYLSLTKAAVTELKGCGIPAGNIDIINHCTYCESGEFHSYRRDHDENGRQHNFIYL